MAGCFTWPFRSKYTCNMLFENQFTNRRARWDPRLGQLPKSHGRQAFDRVVPHVWQTFLKIREKVWKTACKPLIFSRLRFSRRGEKCIKSREKDLSIRRRPAGPNLPVFNDFWVQCGGFSGFRFSGRVCKMYQNAISGYCKTALVHWYKKLLDRPRRATDGRHWYNTTRLSNLCETVMAR